MRSILTSTATRAALLLLAGVLVGCGSTEPELDLGLDFSDSPLRFKSVFTEEDPRPFGRIVFVWDAVPDATAYRFFEDRDGDSDGDGEPEFVQVGGDIPPDTLEASTEVAVHLFDWANARFKLESCIGTVCTEVGQQNVARLSPAFIQPAIGIGFNIALDETGTTLAAGAPGTSSFPCAVIVPVETVTAECEYSDSLTPEEGEALGLSETVPQAGQVFVLTLVDDVWVQQAALRPTVSDAGDLFGSAVAISDDGNVLAISALGEDSAATGVNGDAADNSADESGAVYIFTRELQGDEFVWTQQAYVKSSNPEGDPDIDDTLQEGDRFGNRVDLSADGLTLAVAAWGEDSDSLLINSGEDNNAAADSGAVYVFANDGLSWSQQAYIKAANAEANDLFGSDIALSDSGDTLAVGAINESSAGSADPFDNSAERSGAVYVFTRSGGAWLQQAFIKSQAAGARDEFGSSVALNGAGDRLAVGAQQEDSDAAGIGGSQSNNDAENTGAAYLFTQTGGSWSQTEFFKASNPDPIDELGFTVALNKTGDKLLVTALREGSNALGINGQGELDFAVDSGAGYLFVEGSGGWEQLAFIKSAQSGGQQLFGWDAAFGLDGDRLAISAFNTSTVFIF
ncbi:MAG: integrin [Gammaproteobacteria bacterium]|jgi:hypothetical protein|nr:integrin [Gammaproteobacteria bacterium]